MLRHLFLCGPVTLGPRQYWLLLHAWNWLIRIGHNVRITPPNPRGSDNTEKYCPRPYGPRAIFSRIVTSSWIGGCNTDTVYNVQYQYISTREAKLLLRNAPHTKLDNFLRPVWFSILLNLDISFCKSSVGSICKTKIFSSFTQISRKGWWRLSLSALRQKWLRWNGWLHLNNIPLHL